MGVELEDRESGRRIKALFKPKSEEGETSGWHRVEVERVAYSLNRLLGMDYVPPSAVRKGEILVDGKEFQEGCFTYFVEGAKQLSEVSTDLWDTSKEVFLSDTRILDVLIHNSDRHHGHFLFGKHWIQGDSLSMGDQEAEMMCAFLIDHAAGFRQEACVRLDHENAFMTGPTRVICQNLHSLEVPDSRSSGGEAHSVLGLERNLRGHQKERSDIGLLRRPCLLPWIRERCH